MIQYIFRIFGATIYFLFADLINSDLNHRKRIWTCPIY